MTSEITDLISTMGFPIVCCGFLGYYVYKIQEKMREAIEKNTDSTEKMCSLIDALHRRMDDDKRNVLQSQQAS